MRRMYWVGEKQLTTKQILLEADFKAIQASKLAERDVVLILLGCGCRPNELFNALLGNSATTIILSAAARRKPAQGINCFAVSNKSVTRSQMQKIKMRKSS